jgi:RsiW-degrading membrane proteinase PrsW (M82 family)
MAVSSKSPSKFWAYVAVVVGAVLLLLGAGTAIGYLGFPLLALGEDLLASQLGQMAGMFLGLVCGSLAVAHGVASIRGRPSQTLRLAPIHVFAIVFAVALGLGSLVLNFAVVEEFLFPPLFALGAALPTVALLAWALRRLGWPITWRQGALALVAGATLSIFLAIVLETVLPVLASILIEPLGALAEGFSEVSSTGGFLDRLFLSPAIIVFLMITAVEAPLPEEFAKALGLTLFGRRRITEAGQAFAIGMACGAGFAIVENMLYEGLYAQGEGWSWAGITLLRAVGSVMHPLCTGLVALGWFRARRSGGGQLVKAYLLAVGLHTLWNGGYLPFVYMTGLDYFTEFGASVSLYGLAEEALLVVFLVALSIGLWWYLGRLAAGLGREREPEPAPAAVAPRALAVWAGACLLVIVPIGAALGPAWREIQAVLFPGR